MDGRSNDERVEVKAVVKLSSYHLDMIFSFTPTMLVLIKVVVLVSALIDLFIL